MRDEHRGRPPCSQAVPTAKQEAAQVEQLVQRLDSGELDAFIDRMVPDESIEPDEPECYDDVQPFSHEVWLARGAPTDPRHQERRQGLTSAAADPLWMKDQFRDAKHAQRFLLGIAMSIGIMAFVVAVLAVLIAR